MEHSITNITTKGVVFGKSIRSHYAILHVVTICSEDAAANEQQYVVVRINFLDNPTNTATEMRSWCRRSCKLGDLVEFKGEWIVLENRGTDNFVVSIDSVENADTLLTVKQVRYWSMPQCQEWQQKYRPKVAVVSEKSDNDSKRTTKRIKTDTQGADWKQDNDTLRHGGNKRDQGECVADFLIKAMMYSLQKNQSESTTSETLSSGGMNEDWMNDNPELRAKAIEALNKGSGVIDAAGGSGYVSMVLGIKAVKATVVDPRESVGKLPRRDRKVWNRLMRGVPKTKNGDGGVLLCQPVVPYDSLRAWFARPPPENVDTSFRHGDVESIPVCDEEHDLLVKCSAIVALHPDEATDAIVDMAVKRRIPFVVVPCCVFSRFFTYRRKPGTNNLPVTTYDDLLDYLCSKHESIQRTTLPFQGANVALWSVFETKVL